MTFDVTVILSIVTAGAIWVGLHIVLATLEKRRRIAYALNEYERDWKDYFVGAP